MAFLYYLENNKEKSGSLNKLVSKTYPSLGQMYNIILLFQYLLGSFHLRKKTIKIYFIINYKEMARV